MKPQSWRCWSDWAWRQKADLDPDEYAALVREARRAETVRLVPLAGEAWAIQSGGLILDAGWSREEMRKRCQRMGWRYE